MVQLDALLPQFAGVISGFDFGDGVDPGSIGFGSLPNATYWMQGTSTAAAGDGGGRIFSLDLLRQYAANFSADGHGGTMITESTSGAATPTTLVVPH